MTRVAELCPEEFTEIEELFDLMSEFIKPLRIDSFKQLILHIHLSPKLQAALLADIALPFLANIPRQMRILDLDQNDLIQFFLPVRANSMVAAENVKYSFLLECLLANFFERGLLTYSTNFQVAVKAGITSRLQHAIGDGRRRSKGTSVEGGSGRDELRWSGERIGWYLDLAKSK